MSAPLVVATQIWDANRHSQGFSSAYDESWVDRLYRGFARNLTIPFEFHCFTDRARTFAEPVIQQRLETAEPGYGSTLEAYRLDRAMIKCGLDTIITGNIDHFADYCLTASRLALPRAIYRPETVCNGVALVPPGFGWIWDTFDGNRRPQADMEHLRAQDYTVLDDLFPGHAVSYKGHVKLFGLGDARIVFFHGREKPHEIDAPWIKEHWI